MAKKKRKQPPSRQSTRSGSKSARPGSGTKGTSSSTRPVAGATVRQASAGPPKTGAVQAETESRAAAVNRQARKEQARKHREALRRKAARRRIYRRMAVVGGVVVAVAAIGFFVSQSGGAEVSPEQQRLLNQARTAASAVGCEDVLDIPEFPNGQDQVHIGGPNGPPTMPPFSDYPSTPPVSGPHSGATQPAGIYETPPPIDQVLHSMEHGAAVIWYAPDASADELAAIQNFFRSPEEQDHVIVAQYDYPDQGPQGTLPEGSKMALAAWHHVRYCDDVSLPVAFDFVHRFGTTPHSEYEGEAPEAGGQI